MGRGLASEIYSRMPIFGEKDKRVRLHGVCRRVPKGGALKNHIDKKNQNTGMERED